MLTSIDTGDARPEFASELGTAVVRPDNSRELDRFHCSDDIKGEAVKCAAGG